MNDLAALARLVDALRPWHSQLVIVGGWAHRLHRLHPLANSPPHQALRTRDVDIAFDLVSELDGDIAIALKDAGFQEELSSDHEPPVSRYHLGNPDRGFYAEFVAPLRGSATNRDGTPKATVGQAGITAQKVRHLELLLIEPWAIRVSPAVDLPLTRDATIQVPHPVTFMAQKLLIQRRRHPEKQAQDVLYIHDTLELFGSAIERLASDWAGTIRPHVSSGVVGGIKRSRHEQFDRVTDVIRSAARIPQDRRLTAERIRDLCAYGLGMIFGD